MIVSAQALSYARRDDVNTDVIWPGKYTYVKVPLAEMPRYAMETFDPEFGAKVAGKGVLVVGKNFGCGSSREQASQCLKASGIELIVARSFARIFYRNSLNLGLAVVECPDAVQAIHTGDEVRADLAAGTLEVRGRAFEFAPYPPFVLDLVRDGGLIEHLRAARARGQGQS
ncbi:MAG: 3-isopropylmalate dehydratase [Planctomycetota bacterium]